MFPCFFTKLLLLLVSAISLALSEQPSLESDGSNIVLNVLGEGLTTKIKEYPIF